MGRIKRGGYIIEWWMGDHYPKHLHIYKDGREIAKVIIPNMIVISGRVDKKLKRILNELLRDKRI